MPPDESLYEPRLAEGERATFGLARGELDLTDEIRLIRTVLAHLAEDISLHHRDLGTALSVLLRAISLQSRGLGPTELERTLLELAEGIRLDIEAGTDSWQVLPVGITPQFEPVSFERDEEDEGTDDDEVLFWD